MGHSLPDLEFMGGYRVIQFCRGLALSVFTSHRNLAHPARPSHRASGLRAGSWARPLLRSQPAGLLWLVVHRGTWGTPRHILAIGAFSALVAAGFQGMTRGPAPRKVSVAGEPEASRPRICHPSRLAVAHLNLKLSRLSWSTDRQPISFMSRSISARRFSSALSTPA
jgi:hypothetical protein